MLLVEKHFILPQKTGFIVETPASGRNVALEAVQHLLCHEDRLIELRAAMVTIAAGGGDTLTVRVQAYGTTSGAPGYLNRDALQAGIVSPTAAVNPTDGYDKTLQNIVAQYASGPVDQQLFYAVHTLSTRYADFCSVTLAGPAQPCQRVQDEERESLGGGVRKIWTTQIEGFPTQFLTGAQWRTDVIDDLQAPTIYRHISAVPPSICQRSRPISPATRGCK